MFKILHTSGRARVGLIKTLHGYVSTPVFMPVATKGAVKTLTMNDLDRHDAIISNAIHMEFTVGSDTLKKMGGIHRYTGFSGTIFTDSGGFQNIRKGFEAKPREDGVIIRNPYTGKRVMLTPEKIMEWQHNMGSDVAMILDYCPPYGSERSVMEKSIELTASWTERFLNAHPGGGQLVFGIIQGGLDAELRKKSAISTVELEPDGYAIGGLSIGEPAGEMLKTVAVVSDEVPEDRPLYLMGLGSPMDILDSISLGVDVFDSVYPARIARHGTLLTENGMINIKKAAYATDSGPIDPECTCPVCRRYSRSLLHSLYRHEKLAYMRLATLHNLHFMQTLMTNAKKSIIRGEFEEFKHKFKKKFTSERT